MRFVRFSATAVALVMMLGLVQSANARSFGTAFRSSLFNPFAVEATANRRLAFQRLYAAQTDNPFDSDAESEEESASDSASSSAAEVLSATASGSSSEPTAAGLSGTRPPYTPPVRSPYRPAPRPGL